MSPRTVRKYLPPRPPGRPRGDLRWPTFLRLHAQGIIACDFMVVVTTTFRMLYAFVVIEHGSRRLGHFSVTAHPTATWTVHQLREAIGFEERYHHLLLDRDIISASRLDESVCRLGVEVLKSPPRCPKANSICERVIGTVRRECLDWLIPLSESHLRSILGSCIAHYNAAGRKWRWAQAFQILRPPITTINSPILTIAAPKPTRSESNLFSADCIKNIFSRRHVLDWFFANERWDLLSEHHPHAPGTAAPLCSGLQLNISWTLFSWLHSLE